MSEPKKEPLDRMVEAYENMLERVDGLLTRAGESRLPSVRQSILHAREKAVELDELSREEADRVALYLERDVQDAAGFLARSGREFRNWLRFESELIEGRLLEMFRGVADKTVLELEQLAEQAELAAIYQTGEVTGPGTLICGQCGKAMHFHKTGHIPPCPKCHATIFRRVEGEGV